MKSKMKSFLPAALCSLGACGAIHGQSAWLPPQGDLVASPSFTFSTFDEFWVGDTKVSPLKDNGESMDQINVFISLEYGILDRLAADATIGYTQVGSTTTFGNGDEKGLADTLLGVRYQVLEETDVIPALSVRLGGVIAGTYDENTPFSPGDGANALDGSILLAKAFGYSGFGSYGDIGYRVQESPVPDEFFASVGVYKQFYGLFSELDALTVNVGYRHIQSTDGLDIMGPGFNPGAGSASGFPALKEINQLLEAAIGYTDSGGRHYQFSLAKSLDGRNTGDKWVFGFSASFPFGIL